MSETKVVKNMQKNNPRTTLQLFSARNSLKKHLIFEKMTTFQNMAKIGHHAKAIAFKNRHFGSKISIFKNVRKATLIPH